MKEILRRRLLWIESVSMIFILGNIMWGEKIGQYFGFGGDGRNYAALAANVTKLLTTPPVAPLNLMQRCLPSLLVGWPMVWWQVAMTPANLIYAFCLLNCASALIALWYFRRIAHELHLSTRAEIIAFSFCFLGFYMLKGISYYPVMTDGPAFAMGLASFYFYLRDHRIRLAIVTLMCGLTWPSGFFTGLILLAFPRGTRFSISSSNVLPLKTLATLVSMAVYFYLFWLYQIDQQTPAHGDAQIDRSLIYWSAAIAVGYIIYVQFGFVSGFVGEKLKFENLPQMITMIAVAAVVFLARAWFLDFYSTPITAAFYTQHISMYLNQTLVNPGHFLAAHFIFFGPALAAVLVGVRPIFARCQQYGVGLCLVFWITLMFMINSESRHLLYHLPVFFIFAASTLDNQLEKRHTLLAVSAQIVASHAWLPLDLNWDQNKPLAWPHQRWVMNFGPWLNYEMYLVGIAGFILCSLVIWRMRYRPEARQKPDKPLYAIRNHAARSRNRPAR